MYNRKRRGNDSPIVTAALAVVAAAVLVVAVIAVYIVFHTIQSDYKRMELAEETEELTEAPIEIEQKEEPGWNETEEGWSYLLEDGTYVTESWKEIDGFLYYFDEQGIMKTGEWKKDGQIFTCHDVKGYLKDIQIDFDYVPEDTGENLDSLVRTNAFWCYLDDTSGGIFKTILYRKTVETKVLPLGDADDPEKTTAHSMRVDGDFVYYLPKVEASQEAQLSDSEKALCNVLTRMRPGQKVKEILAEQVGGYLILDHTVYYSQNGKIYHTTAGTELAVGRTQYSAEIEQGDCYLVDAAGNRAESENGQVLSIGDRSYTLDPTGRVERVSQGSVESNGAAFSLEGTGSNARVYRKDSAGGRTVIQADYGVQGFCVVDNAIYYSSFVDKGSDGSWVSQIFRTDLQGENKRAVSQPFQGSVGGMYYFEDTGHIYGEYFPEVWKNSYGVIVQIRENSMVKLYDKDVRIGERTSGNDMMTPVMEDEGTLICLWQDCQWNRNSGITRVLWSKAVALDHALGEAVEAVPETKAEPETTTAAVQPLEPSASQTQAPQTAAQEAPTLAPMPETVPETSKAQEVTIIPLH